MARMIWTFSLVLLAGLMTAWAFGGPQWGILNAANTSIASLHAQIAAKTATAAQVAAAETVTANKTVTPTLVPTVCGATPSLVSSEILNGTNESGGNGCLGNGSPTSWSFTVPSLPGEILLVQVESGGPTITGVTVNGVGISPFPSDSAVAIPDVGNIYSYYLLNPPAGTDTIGVGGGGCSFNVVASLYDNIDTASAATAFGAIATSSGTAATFADKITTVGTGSILADFFAYLNGNVAFTGMTGTALWPDTDSQCCDNVFGSYDLTAAPGAYTLDYGYSSTVTGTWNAVTAELKAAACGAPAPNLASVPWVLNGNAVNAQTGDVILTQNLATQAGSMWDPCTINLADSFDLTFTLNLGGNEFGCGADGLAFVLQNSGTNVIGADSGEHGYDNGSIGPNSLAVVLNTYQNVGAPYRDPAYENLGIEDNDSVSDVACGASGPVTITGPCMPPILPGDADATSAQNLTVEFVWIPSGSSATMKVVVNGNQQAVWAVDNYASIFSNAAAVYFGMTGADGGSYNLQQAGLDAGSTVDNGVSVTSPSFCAVASPTPNNNPSEMPTPFNCNLTPTSTSTPSPTATPSPTTTPSPVVTVCGATPAFVSSEILNGTNNGGSGCLGSGNPTSWSFTVPSLPGEILLVQVESGGQPVTGVTVNGTAITAFPSDSVVAISSGDIYSYYLLNPPIGADTIGVGAAGCSFNVVASLYDNVDTASAATAFGAIATSSGTAATFADNITTVGTGSILADFFAYPNGSVAFTGMTGTALWPDTDTQCCDDVFGSYYLASAPGAYTLDYGYNSTVTNPWSAVTAELKAATCGTPTFSPTTESTPGALDGVPWVLNGNAAYAQTGDVILTSAVSAEAGSMWDPCTINLADSFDLSFTINLGGNEFGCGGDGMAFVLQNSGTGVVGADSGEHGYDNGTIGVNSLAVVLDTYQNLAPPYSDPAYESLGIEDDDSVSDVACGASGPVTISGPCRPAILPGGADATVAQNITVEFIWTPSGANATMAVKVNGSQQASWTVDSYASIFSNANAVYFGITGSGGGVYNLQQAALNNGSTVDSGVAVTSPSFCAVASPTPNSNPSQMPTPNNCGVTPTFTPTP